MDYKKIDTAKEKSKITAEKMGLKAKSSKITKLNDRCEEIQKEIDSIECPWAPKNEKKIEKLEEKLGTEWARLEGIMFLISEEEYWKMDFSKYGYNWEDFQEN